MSIREILDKIDKKGITKESVAACENLEHMKYTILHQRVIKDLEKELGVEALGISKYHDLDKVVFYYVMLADDANSLHVTIQKHHHVECSEYRVCVEKALDWESAYRTKPDKLLSAYETLLKLHSEQKEFMEPVLKSLGLWEKGNYKCITMSEYYELSKTVSVDDVLEALKQGVVYLEALANVI